MNIGRKRTHVAAHISAVKSTVKSAAVHRKPSIILFPSLAGSKLYAKWDIDADVAKSWRGSSKFGDLLVNALGDVNLGDLNVICQQHNDTWVRVWVSIIAALPSKFIGYDVANCWRQLCSTYYVDNDSIPGGFAKKYFDDDDKLWKKQKGIQFSQLREKVPRAQTPGSLPTSCPITRDWGGCCASDFLTSLDEYNLAAAAALGKLESFLESIGYEKPQFDTDSFCQHKYHISNQKNICNCFADAPKAELTNKDSCNMFTLPYDWTATLNTQERRDYFAQVKEFIEWVYERDGQPVSLISHSLGCNIASLFINEYIDCIYFKYDLKKAQKWKNKFVKAWFPIAPPLAGTPSGTRSVLSGQNEGLGALCVDTNNHCDSFFQVVQCGAGGCLMVNADDIVYRDLNIVRVQNTYIQKEYTTQEQKQMFADAKFLQGSLFEGFSLLPVYQGLYKTWINLPTEDKELHRYLTQYKMDLNHYPKPNSTPNMSNPHANQLTYQPPNVEVHAVYVASRSNSVNHDENRNMSTGAHAHVVRNGSDTSTECFYEYTIVEDAYNANVAKQHDETEWYNSLFHENGNPSELQIQLRGGVPVDQMYGDGTVTFLGTRVPELWKATNRDYLTNDVKPVTSICFEGPYTHRDIVSQSVLHEYLTRYL